MAQYDFQIADYERIFRKRYKIVLAAVFLAVIFSIMFARMKRPVYQASATVKVDRNTVMGLGMEAIMFGVWDNIETQTKVITSFPVLLRAAHELKIISDTITEDIHLSDEEILSELEKLKAKVSTSVSSGTNIIRISAKSHDPKQARDVANAMAFAYKRFSIDGKKQHASKTKEFVTDQLQRCRDELAGAESEVERFAETQKIPSIDANATRIISDAARIEQEIQAIDDAIKIINVQQRKLNDRLSGKTARLDIDTTQSNVDPSQSQMGWVSQFTDSDPGLSRLNSRLIALQVELEDQKSYFKEDHPATRTLEKRINETIEQILAEYDKKLGELVKKKNDVLEENKEVEQEMQLLPANQMHYARLMRKLKVKEELNAMLTKKLEEARIAEAGVVDDVTIMALATVPRGAINKNVHRAAGVGIFLGLIFGIIFAIVREMFDTSIGTIEDVERSLNIAVLAVIPHISIDELKGKKNGKANKSVVNISAMDAQSRSAYLRSFLVTHFHSKDPTAESYRILRTNLEYLSFERSYKTFLLTSATMQEGKSTTIANLAIAFAQQGKKVLLLECNLRRPSLQRIFGTDSGPGTTDILVDKANWQECVRTVTDLALGAFSMEEIMLMPGLENFNIINYGHRPPNPAELLSSKKMDNLLGELREHFDMVLVDAPPLLPVADSIVLSNKTDGVILIYMVGKAPRNSLRLAKERLEAVQSNILGLVLNDIRPETTGLTYSSYYMYSYTSSKDKDHRKKHKSKSISSRLFSKV